MRINEKIFVCANTDKEPIEFEINENIDVMLSKNVQVNKDKLLVGGHGYIIAMC